MVVPNETVIATRRRTGTLRELPASMAAPREAIPAVQAFGERVAAMLNVA